MLVDWHREHGAGEPWAFAAVGNEADFIVAKHRNGPTGTSPSNEIHAPLNTSPSIEAGSKLPNARTVTVQSRLSGRYPGQPAGMNPAVLG